MMNDRDGDFYEVASEAEHILNEAREHGQFASVFQKFTCVACRARKTMPEPNVFYTQGHCDSCGWTTDIASEGCGYMLIISADQDEHEEFVELVSSSIRSSPPNNRN